MLKVALRSLGAHKLRLALSGLAVVLGVAFVAGTFVFTDTLRSTFEELFGQTDTDVSITALAEFETEVTAGTVPDSLIATVEALPDVAKATGFVQANGVTIIGTDGDPVGTAGAPTFGVSWGDDPALSPLSLVDGRGPAAPDEVAIDTQSAEQGGFVVGDPIALVTPGPRVEATLVGIFRYGTTGNLAGASLTAFDPATAQELLTAPGEWTEIAILGREGVSQEALKEQVVAAVGPDYLVRTAEEAEAEASRQLTEGLQFFNIFLLVFAGIALFVGTFLILNTFSMLVAQRTRELALLRAIGASRSQVTGSLLAEAALVGAVGGLLGLAVGVGLALALQGLFGAIGIEIPSAGLVIQPRTVLVALLLGLGITVLAALLPARRAASVPPVAAMRDDLVLPVKSLRRRTWIGSVVLLLSVLLAAAGLATAGESAGNAASLVGLAALAALVGVIIVAPSLSGPVVAVLGAPMRGTAIGRIAVGNARRNRRRTALTATALMIGLALVSAFGVLGSSTTKSTDATVERVLGADYIVTATNFFPFSPDIAAAIAEVDGVQTVARIMIVPAQVDGSSVQLVGVDIADVAQVLRITTVDGSLEAVVAGELLVDETTATNGSVAVGDEVTLTLQTGSEQRSIGGVYEAGPLFSGYVASRESLIAAGAQDLDQQVLVKVAEGADATQVRADLDAALAPYPTVQLQDQTEFKEQIRSQINQLLAIIYALLGLAVIIAILGIVNTLALSVAERTREIGLLRAVGATRPQVRQMIRRESLLIAVFGALLGVAVGPNSASPGRC
jgi:putative ABC transport system permease protein